MAVGPAFVRRAEEVALRVEGQDGRRIGSVGGTVEGGEGGEGAATGGQLEHRAIIGGSAEFRRAEEIALRVAGQAGHREGAVGAIERGQGGGGIAAGGQLPGRAQVVGPASVRRAEEVALCVADHAGKRLGPVGAVERGQRGGRGSGVGRERPGLAEYDEADEGQGRRGDRSHDNSFRDRGFLPFAAKR